MNQPLTKIAFAIVIFFSLCGFSVQKAPAGLLSQPQDERRAQDLLPKSHDITWQTLGKTKIHMDAKKGLYSATYPDEVKALVGKQITISGFILPLENTEKFKHFILSKRTPTCPFCPPGEPNEIIDIYMQKPITWSEDTIKITGTFELVDNKQLGMFFKIKDAKKS